jgi:hypothetical protein
MQLGDVSSPKLRFPGSNLIFEITPSLFFGHFPEDCDPDCLRHNQSETIIAARLTKNPGVLQGWKSTLQIGQMLSDPSSNHQRVRVNHAELALGCRIVGTRDGEKPKSRKNPNGTPPTTTTLF